MPSINDASNLYVTPPATGFEWYYEEGLMEGLDDLIPKSELDVLIGCHGEPGGAHNRLDMFGLAKGQVQWYGHGISTFISVETAYTDRINHSAGWTLAQRRSPKSQSVTGRGVYVEEGMRRAQWLKTSAAGMIGTVSGLLFAHEYLSEIQEYDDRFLALFG